MNKTAQLIVNAVLVLAVAVLFYLHFSSRPAAAPVAATPKVTMAADSTAEVPVDEVATVASADSNKVAYVESNKLLEGYKGMQVARKSFEVKAKGWQAQNDALVRNFQAAVQKYQQTAQSLTNEQRAATEQNLQQQEAQAGQKQQQLQQQAAQEEAKMTKTVLDRVEKQIEKYGKENGYRMILISSPGGAIAYARKELDITAPVLKYLNDEYSAKK
ncbi:OmpH family outer membrane protein [Hymenobacter aerilatus]|uniref:OmpH family outer membrane protein n=1 Tax=Hymenobacter aerilatus TaxID=2932251 RepID=A0A8T9SW84_9BACT|nr:OmpH family outer membrane protein [Hymenobacter aerilatus]UOR06328.1 OmpH family outer membrane protein [Hymenobacter aerilatus]